MKQMDGYFETDGGKLYYEVAGEGEPLVLVHAAFVDSGMWDDQWQAFAKHYRVVRFDMRGFGKSDPATGPVTRRHDLYNLLNHLDIERAHLLGCSMGGEIVLDLALEHPEMAASVIAVSAMPSGFAMQGEPPPHLMDMFGAMQAGDLERASALQIRIWVDGMFRQPDQVNAHVRQRAAAMNRIPVTNGTFFIADAQPANPLNPPAIERLGDVAVPVLVIAGALDHPEVLRAADLMESGIDGAEKAIIADAAHVPNMEQPTTFNETVLRFLRGIDA